MSETTIFWVIVSGAVSNAGFTKWFDLPNGEIPETFRVHVERLADGSTAISPKLDLGLFSSATPESIANALSNQIQDAFGKGAANGASFDEVRLVAYSAGAPIMRYAFARALGFFDNGRREGTIEPWAERTTRIVYMAGILRGWSISTATPAHVRFFAPISTAFMRVWCSLVKGHQPLLWQLRRQSAFISLSRLLDLERRKWCRSENRLCPDEITLLGTQDEFIAPDDCIEQSGIKNCIFAEVSGTNHGGMIRISSEGNATDNHALGKQNEQRSKIDRGLCENIEDLRNDPKYAISADDINDYFDPLDRPEKFLSDGDVAKVGHAVIEPRRVCRRLICLSYAAMSDLSRAA